MHIHVAPISISEDLAQFIFDSGIYAGEISVFGVLWKAPNKNEGGSLGLAFQVGVPSCP